MRTFVEVIILFPSSV